MTKHDPPTERKPRIEVQQESQERLEVLQLDHTPRDAKMAREGAFVQGASEISYQERAFRPRHKASIDEVRASVDGLRVQRRELPPIPQAPAPPAPPAALPRPIADEHRRALEPVVPGVLVAVEPIYSTDAGDVVEAHWEADGTRASRTFLVRDGTATPADDVSKRIDELPAPRDAVAPSVPPAPEPEPKKRKLGLPKFGRKKGDK